MLEMIKKIQEAEDYASLGAASKEQIADAENELKLKFSEDYKEYLSTFGAATFCGKELTGICPAICSFSSLRLICS